MLDDNQSNDNKPNAPRIYGFLYRRGYFGDWRKRFVELRNDGLHYSIRQGGKRWGTTPLTASTRCEESALRHFCFCIKQPDGTKTFFAAPNISVKEAWLELIQSRLSDLRLRERRRRRQIGKAITATSAVGALLVASSSNAERQREENRDSSFSRSISHLSSASLSSVGYAFRPTIYIKVIRARNLLAKDSMMENLRKGVLSSDPYVKVTLGSSTARTITRKKDLNPEWGMVFPFPWDINNRYAKVEVWDEDTTTGVDHFLGQVLLPVYHFIDGDVNLAWYPLCKRTPRSTVEGDIELEIACTGQPDPLHRAWNLFRVTQQLPELRMNLAARTDGFGQISLDFESNTMTSSRPLDNANELEVHPHMLGFPVSFPPLETERIEDFSLRVHMIINSMNSSGGTGSNATGIRMSIPGYLFLTNYRIIFVSNARVFADSQGLISNQDLAVQHPLRPGNRKFSTASAMSGAISKNHSKKKLSTINAIKMKNSTQTSTLSSKGGVRDSCRTTASEVSDHDDDPCEDEEVDNFLELIPKEDYRDVTTQIPIASIVRSYFTTDVDPEGGSTASFEVVRIRTTDGRIVSFMFKEDAGDSTNNFSKTREKIKDRSTEKIAKISYSPKPSIDSSRNPSRSSGSVNSNMPWSFSSLDNTANDADHSSPHVTPSPLNKQPSAILEADETRESGVVTKRFQSSSNNNYINANLNSSTSLLKPTVRARKMSTNANNGSTLRRPSRSGSILSIAPVSIAATQRKRSSFNDASQFISIVGDRTSISSTYGKEPSPHVQKISDLEQNWLNLVRQDCSVTEGLQSEEGSPAHRIYLSLKLKAINRACTRDWAINVHRSLLQSIRRSCGFEPLPDHFYSHTTHSYQTYTDTSTLASMIPAPIQLNDIENVTHNDADEGNEPKSKNPNTIIMNPLIVGNETSSEQLNCAEKDNDDDQISKTEKEWYERQTVTATRREFSLNGLETRVANSDYLSKSCTKLLHNLDNCWMVYDASIEFTRLGLPNSRWRISSVNRNYEVSPTYPALWAVPAAVNDNDLIEAATFRSKGRLPILSWINKSNRCTICRAAQPLVGLKNNRNPLDETLISEINACGAISFYTESLDNQNSAKNNTALPQLAKPYVIVDARPLLNAKANQAAGKGVESDKVYSNCAILFMDIANIHAVRKSHEMLEEACSGSDEHQWSRNLEASGWLNHIRRILLSATKIVHFVSRENLSVLVHCSDGWDRTAQLVALSMLMLDPYYRTIFGFIVLIEKEWISFGHKFGDRLGWTVDGWKDEERSPIFVQFLDCVHQILNQHPAAFEFTEDLLLFIMSHLHSGWFGNFLFNTEAEVRYHCQEKTMLSLWTPVLGNITAFKNPYYAPTQEFGEDEGYAPVVPIVTRSRIVLWHKWYLRWQDRLWGLAWEETIQLDIKKGAESGAWADKASATNCAKCETRFHPCWCRKHHCRSCGQIFCRPCSDYFRVVATISASKTSRCCAECAYLIDTSYMELMARHESIRFGNSLSHSYGASDNRLSVLQDAINDNDATQQQSFSPAGVTKQPITTPESPEESAALEQFLNATKPNTLVRHLSAGTTHSSLRRRRSSLLELIIGVEDAAPYKTELSEDVSCEVVETEEVHYSSQHRSHANSGHKNNDVLDAKINGSFPEQPITVTPNSISVNITEIKDSNNGFGVDIGRDLNM